MELENAYVDYISILPYGNVSKIKQLLFNVSEYDFIKFVYNICTCKHIRDIKNINYDNNLYIQNLVTIIQLETDRRQIICATNNMMQNNMMQNIIIQNNMMQNIMIQNNMMQNNMMQNNIIQKNTNKLEIKYI